LTPHQYPSGLLTAQDGRTVLALFGPCLFASVTVTDRTVALEVHALMFLNVFLILDFGFWILDFGFLIFDV
jgi:hypothetical protein